MMHFFLTEDESQEVLKSDKRGDSIPPPLQSRLPEHPLLSIFLNQKSAVFDAQRKANKIPDLEEETLTTWRAAFKHSGRTGTRLRQTLSLAGLSWLPGHLGGCSHCGR